MTSYEQLGKAAYVAYYSRALGRAIDGEDWPTWDQLGPERQACWTSAAQAVAEQIAALH